MANDALSSKRLGACLKVEKVDLVPHPRSEVERGVERPFFADGSGFRPEAPWDLGDFAYLSPKSRWNLRGPLLRMPLRGVIL